MVNINNLKPIILVIPTVREDIESFAVNKRYCSMVEKNGGVPVVASYGSQGYIKRVLDISSGVIFTGGGDVSPDVCAYEKAQYVKKWNIERDLFEKALFKEAFDRKKPMLGICRGMQIMSLFTGGGIFSDVSLISNGSINHSQNEERNKPSHIITIKKGSLLYEITKEETIYVNSFHHQAADLRGSFMELSAYAPDGVAEAMEYNKNGQFMLSVQWHPEAMEESRVSNSIFNFFINKAI